MIKSKTIKIEFTDPVADNRWDNYVKSHPDGSIYHTSTWMRIIHKSFGYHPYYIIMLDGNANVTGAAPTFLIKSLLTDNRLVSLPFSDHCDLLLNDQLEMSMLYKFLSQNAVYLNAEYIELKSRLNGNYYTSTGFSKIENSLNHSLPLANRSLDDIKKSFHKSFILRNINKALKSPLKIVEGKDLNDIKTAYNLLLLTRKKHGLPPHPFSFYKNMWKLMPGTMLKVYLAMENKKAVATIIVAIYKNTAYYLYGGSNSSCMTNRPNHLLLWSAIEKAWENGTEYFDFGRSGINNKSLIVFKQRWGAVETGLPSYWLSMNGKKTISLNRGAVENKFVTKLVQTIPNPILKVGSNLVYKHLG